MNVILKIGLIFNLGYLIQQFKNMNILITKMLNIFHYICACVFLFHFILFVTMPMPSWAMGSLCTFGIVKEFSMKWCASLSLCNFKIINSFSSYWRNPWGTSHWPFYLPFHTITFHTLEPTTYEPATLNNFTNEVSKLVWEEFCVIYQMVFN
jgi:hypothetical protein